MLSSFSISLSSLLDARRKDAYRVEREKKKKKRKKDLLVGSILEALGDRESESTSSFLLPLLL
jgi:hypothetical protein